jgi:hypothetical protein
VEKCPENPSDEDDGAQDLHDDDLRALNKTVEVEGLFAARRPEVEGELRHTDPLFLPAEIEE